MDARRSLYAALAGMLLSLPTIVLGWLFLAGPYNLNHPSDVTRMLTIGTCASLGFGALYGAALQGRLFAKQAGVRSGFAILVSALISFSSVLTISLIPSGSGPMGMGTALMSAAWITAMLVPAHFTFAALIGALLRPAT